MMHTIRYLDPYHPANVRNAVEFWRNAVEFWSKRLEAISAFDRDRLCEYTAYRNNAEDMLGFWKARQEKWLKIVCGEAVL